MTNSGEIHLFAANDETTLEYEDRVLLRFTADRLEVIHAIEAAGEYVRDTASVNIIDSKQPTIFHFEIIFCGCIHRIGD